MSGRPPGKIRIVAGTHRGRRLRVIPSEILRPTSEKVREAVFDVLGPVAGLSVADLFAGTGAMGLEALSRGAGRCVFVEGDPAVAAVLLENIAALEYEPVCRVIVSGFERALAGLVRSSPGFDLLFVDPPYRMLAEVEVTLTPLLPSLLSEDGVVVIEGDKSSPVDIGPTPVFDRVYGDTRVTMVRMRRSAL